ncbi:MAG: mechanosensitive ion channel family protein [Bryobacteraceae bacterium]
MARLIRLLTSGALALLFCCLAFPPAAVSAAKAPAKPPPDALGRTNPRSAVTEFLQTCQRGDYQKAASYLDLRDIASRRRAKEGPHLAKELESILNSDSHFDVLRLSQGAQGNLTDDPNPNIERVTALTRNGETFTLELERVQLSTGQPPIWLFTSATVAAIPRLASSLVTISGIQAYLPPFLVSVQFLKTPLWKWIALLILFIVLILVFRLIVRLLVLLLRSFQAHWKHSARWIWIQAVIEPWLLFLFAIIFGIVEQLINPSALARLYIGRAILLAIVAAFAWWFINVFDLFLARMDRMLEPRQRTALRSLIYLGRRTAKIVILGIALIVVLNNWGYQMTTVIAGLGVGGIAIALAAQGTIANVFGGVSVIGDRPVMIGDYGSFGGLLGTVEDIGMRSTRIRTLSRTLVSIPNAHFATINLENFTARDKILFNPSLQIKRATPKDQLRRCVESLEDMLKQNRSVEIGRSPVRVSALAAGFFTVEIFAYVLTADTDQYYKIQAELLLAVDDVLTQSGIELV